MVILSCALTWLIRLEETAMDQAVHQLLQLILQGITWVLKTFEALWVWSWSQITWIFSMSWGDLPAWKMALGVAALLTLASLLFVMAQRGLAAFGQIAGAFWTMTLTMFTFLSFIVIAGVLSRGFQWVVASVPDDFWQKFI
jgi:hypothetical protein